MSKINLKNEAKLYYFLYYSFQLSNFDKYILMNTDNSQEGSSEQNIYNIHTNSFNCTVPIIYIESYTIYYIWKHNEVANIFDEIK